MDGLAPFTYSEELPYDDMLEQHRPGVQERTAEDPVLVVATLPRADSPSVDKYVAERQGKTAWTMDKLMDAQGGVTLTAPPNDAVTVRSSAEHVSLHVYNPTTARSRDLCATELESKGMDRTIHGFQASLLSWLIACG